MKKKIAQMIVTLGFQTFFIKHFYILKINKKYLRKTAFFLNFKIYFSISKNILHLIAYFYLACNVRKVRHHLMQT